MTITLYPPTTEVNFSYSCAAGDAVITLPVGTNLNDGDEICLEEAGFNAQVPTPAAPVCNVRGTPGSKYVEYLFVSQTEDYGRSASGPTTIVTTAPDVLDSTNYVEITLPTDLWPAGVKWVFLYRRFANNSNFLLVKVFSVNTHLRFVNEVEVYYDIHNSISKRIEAIRGIPTFIGPTGVLAAVPNWWITKIVKGANPPLEGAQAGVHCPSGQVTVSPAPLSTKNSGAGTLTYYEPLMRALVSGDSHIHFGHTGSTVPIAGTMQIQRGMTISINNPGSDKIVFKDGHGVFVSGTWTALCWRPGARVFAGQRVRPVNTWQMIQPGGDWGTGGKAYDYSSDGVTGPCGSEPTFAISTIGGTQTDGTTSVRRISATVGASRACLRGIGISIESGSRLRPVGYASVSQDPVTSSDTVNNIYLGFWKPNMAVALGKAYIPTNGNYRGFTFVATNAGTTGSSQPTWPVGVGSTVADNTITWSARLSPMVYGAVVHIAAPDVITDMLDVVATSPSGIGILICGSDSDRGNANHTHVSRSSVSGMGHGIVAYGYDGNGCTINQCNAIGNQYAGYLDSSFLGNVWNGNHANANTRNYQNYGGAQWGSAYLGNYSEGGTGDRLYLTPIVGGNMTMNTKDSTSPVYTGTKIYAPILISNEHMNFASGRNWREEYFVSGESEILKRFGTYDSDISLATQYFELKGRMQYGIFGSNPYDFFSQELIHSARGRRTAFPRGILMGEGHVSTTSEERSLGVAKVIPTSGVFDVGDTLIWSGAPYRKEIKATVRGCLGQAAWVATTAYAEGAIVYPSNITTKAFVCITRGTSGSSFAPTSAVDGNIYTDGTAKWMVWSTIADPVLTAVPFIAGAPVSVSADSTITIDQGSWREIGTLSTTIQITLGTTNAMRGDEVLITSPGAAYAVTIVGANTIVMPSTVVWSVRAKYTGSAWKFIQVGASS